MGFEPTTNLTVSEYSFLWEFTLYMLYVTYSSSWYYASLLSSIS